ncbi:tyrosine-type recombinase/integrase [Pseudomonas putida]|uniref:tyrosine-type recombinase/integrase n=1 Tax=Pseudomonas putida TaxID=303 RepID=UPI0039069D6D
MRVPVYPEDLLPQAAFKRLAKIIQKRWLGQSPVQLSFARETLSRGLGYANYHDLMKKSVIWLRDAETPALSTTQTQLAAEIFSVLALANDTSVPRSVLDPFVETLPLKALSTFKGAASRGVEVTKSPVPDLDQTGICPVNTNAPESEVPCYTCPSVTHKPSRLNAFPLGLDVFTHSDAIKQVVEKSGSLRDRSLFALLETGLRGHVILGTKVSQVVSLKSYMPSSKEVSIEISKAKPPRPLATTAVIERYISEENLSADDFLFPGDDRKQPMSTSQLLQIFQSWERQTQLPGSTLTPSTLRRAAMVRLAASIPTPRPDERIADQLGHSSSSMAEHYVSLATTAANAALKTKKRRT